MLLFSTYYFLPGLEKKKKVSEPKTQYLKVTYRLNSLSISFVMPPDQSK